MADVKIFRVLLPGLFGFCFLNAFLRTCLPNAVMMIHGYDSYSCINVCGASRTE